jgi:hypothetical protein
LRAANVSEGLTGDGPPYFLRDEDLYEWAATLRREPAEQQHPRGLRRLRFHEVEPAPVEAATITVQPEEVCAQLELSHLRGLDELDYYRTVLFRDAAAHQIILNWYERSGSRDAHLHLPDGTHVEEVLTSLCDLLALPPSSVTWRARSGA